MTENARSADRSEELPSRVNKLKSPPGRHHIDWVAAGLRRAAAELGVGLPISYSKAVATDGLTREDELGVSRLGAGVVFHTQPNSAKALPILLGYADARGQWYRDGRRHVEAAVEAPAQPVPGVSI